MMLAHTIVDAPKNGAIRRAAAISAPSDADPTTNTSRPSGGRSREEDRFMQGPTNGEATIAAMSSPPPRSHVWHPFTQMRGFEGEEAPVIESADGEWLVDTEGRRYIDGISSLWCNVHGHRHPRIDTAVREQLDRVAHTTMLGLSHPGGEELARRLVGSRRAGCHASSTPTAAQPPSRSRSRWRSSTGSRPRIDGPPHGLRLPGERVSRRHGRLGVGRRDRPLPLDVPAAAVRLAPRPGRRRRRARSAC